LAGPDLQRDHGQRKEKQPTDSTSTMHFDDVAVIRESYDLRRY